MHCQTEIEKANILKVDELRQENDQQKSEASKVAGLESKALDL